MALKEQTNRGEQQDENQRRANNLEDGAAPQPVGVYERPERSGMSPTIVAVVIIIIALVAAVAAFMFLF